ncbi:MAG: glycoside hydrolase family 43 protein [Anaerolineae bacterium]|jgi:beta-xylosidase|nr:family 43 glycosylhydrolase [Chloroflexota bacterium]
MESQGHCLADIRVRDPHILPLPDTGTYYLTCALGRSEDAPAGGVQVLWSQDLQRWQGPRVVYRVPEDAWGRAGVWAPEMHRYAGRYWLLLTHNSEAALPGQRPGAVRQAGWPPLVRRGSQVLVSSSPLGPFTELANRPTLPPELMTLDGTLWLEDGQPYMVYCHEWVQLGDGAVAAVPLMADLSALAGEPQVLFHGSDAPWATPSSSRPGSWVTDGPSLFHTASGTLLMIWSGFGRGGYTTGLARSASGRLSGPWVQQTEPLFEADGGHGTVFRRLDGQLMLVLHQPNRTPEERARIFELEDLGDSVRIRR